LPPGLRINEPDSAHKRRSAGIRPFVKDYFRRIVFFSYRQNLYGQKPSACGETPVKENTRVVTYV
jgi:hypothetical protein